MRNTTYKLFHEKSLKRLHDDLNICGIVRNHFLGLSMRYYRRYRKSLSAHVKGVCGCFNKINGHAG